jgi:hypothetical protein
MTPEQARRRAEEEVLPDYGIVVSDRSGATWFGYTEGQVLEAIAAALVKLTQGQEPVVARYVTRHGYAANWYDYSAHTDAVWREDMKISGGHIEYAYVIPSQQEERVRELEALLNTAHEALVIDLEVLENTAPYEGQEEILSGSIQMTKETIAAIDAARNKEPGK